LISYLSVLEIPKSPNFRRFVDVMKMFCKKRR
jgi:hypothetical protein